MFFYQTKRLHAKLLLIWTSTIGDKCRYLLLVLGVKATSIIQWIPQLLAFFEMDWELVVSCKSCALHCVLLSPR